MNFRRFFQTLLIFVFSTLFLNQTAAQPGSTSAVSANTTTLGSTTATPDNNTPLGSTDIPPESKQPLAPTGISLEIPICQATRTGTNGCDHEVHTYSGFILCYRESYEQSEWVAYTLTREKLKAVTGRTNDFKSDTKISTESASPKDYTRSGFDRGHLAPAADMEWSKTSVHESFLMSNMSPQVPQLNRGLWKTLEEKVREWTEKYGTLYIVTGPVLEKSAEEYNSIGANKVAVPEYFYKVILAPVEETSASQQTSQQFEKTTAGSSANKTPLSSTDITSANTSPVSETAASSANKTTLSTTDVPSADTPHVSETVSYTAIAFILPNKKCEGTILDYAVTVNEAEQRTGLDFYSALPDILEEQIESSFTASFWN